MPASSGKQWMLDTNTVSYLLKQRPAVFARMRQVSPAALCISAITRSELLYGMERRPSPRLQALLPPFLARVETLDWTREAADVHAVLRAGLERRGISMGAFDLQIAAHAVACDLTLVSSDRAFVHVPGLKWEDWG